MSDHADDGGFSTPSSPPQPTDELYDLTRDWKWDEASRRCRTHPQDAGWKDGDGWLPIHVACGWRRAPLSLIQDLHEAYKEGVRTTDNAGCLPLHWACECASPEVIEYLHVQYPDGAAETNDLGETPADYLKENDKLSEEDKAKARHILSSPHPVRTSPPRPKPVKHTPAQEAAMTTTPVDLPNTTTTSATTSTSTTATSSDGPHSHSHGPPSSPKTSTLESTSTSALHGGGAVEATVIRERAEAGTTSAGSVGRDDTSPSLTTEQHSAIRTLTRNLRDFDRSLEGVRGLPTSLSGSPEHVRRYFRSYVSAFERTYVAAQALSTGAIRGKVSDRAMLVAALENVGKGAETCGVPFAGAVSIFATLALHQMQTRQDNLLGVFQQLFRGDSHMSHVLVCRSAAEQICLRADLSDFSGGDAPSVGKLRAKVQRAMKRVEAKLQKCHLVAVGNLEPIEVKVMSDLATVTEAVMTLWFKSREEYATLKDGKDEDRVDFILNAMNLDESAPTTHPATANAEKELDGRTPSSDLPDDTDAPIVRRTVTRRTQPQAFSGSVRSPSDEVQELRKHVLRLEKRLAKLTPGDDDATVDVPGSGNQCQKFALASKNTRARRAADAHAAREYNQRVDTMDDNIREHAENLHSLSIETFMTRRVLTVLEARKFIKQVLMCSRGETTRAKSEDLHHHKCISTDAKGRFVLRGKSYRVGCIRGRFGTTKKLWNDESEIRFDLRIDGTWSVKCWFVQTGLEHRYNAHCKEVIRQMFAKELLA